MSKKNHNNSTSIEDETTRSEEMDETTEETQTEDTAPVADTEETSTEEPTVQTDTTVIEEPTVKTDTASAEETKTEDTAPVADTEETSTEEPTVKTDDASAEVTVATVQTVIPPAQKVDKDVTLNLASNIEVRYTQLWSNKRTAFLRNMPLYNIINTYIHNRGCFIGLTNSEILTPITDFVMKNPITVEGIKLSDEMKSDFIIKLKSNTDYCKVKWGYK